VEAPFHDLHQLNSFLPGVIEGADEEHKNLSLAKFIHLCEQKALEIRGPQKNLILKVVEKAILYLSCPALKAYFQQRAACKAQVAAKRALARPEEYLYAIASHSLSLKHIEELMQMRKDFYAMACSTLVGEMSISFLYSYLGLGNEEGILSCLQSMNATLFDGVKVNFWTIVEESYFGRNEINPLPLSSLIKIRELYPRFDGVIILISKLLDDELFDVLSTIEGLKESAFKTSCQKAILDRLKIKMIP